MDISDKNLKEVRKLLAELEQLEAALDILSNYDSKVSVNFWTGYNHNLKDPKTVQLPVSSNLRTSIVAEIKYRIPIIKKQLETM